MTPALAAWLDTLHEEGARHDASQSDRLLRRRNLEPPTAALLSLVVRVVSAREVVEIGTGNGYSAIWLADAVADIGGRVVSVDTGPIDDARRNIAGADAIHPGLAGRVECRRADGGAYLATLADDSIAVLFLDAERVEYPRWWPHAARVVRPGGVLAIDNVLSHPDEVAPFLELLAAEASFVGTTVAVGKGLHLAWRRGCRV